jgi:hypothetical protein
MSTITSANSSFAITVPGVYSAPQSVQGYATDDAFAAEAVEKVETLMGIDGKLSAGYIFNPYKMTITLQADSGSLSSPIGNWHKTPCVRSSRHRPRSSSRRSATSSPWPTGT